MTDLSSLLARVKEAKRPSRELDAAICVALRDVRNEGYYKLGAVNQPGNAEPWRIDIIHDTGVVRTHIPDRFSASLDAALALCARVLPGCLWCCGSMDMGPFARILPTNGRGSYVGSREFTEYHDYSPALALLAALLTAMEQKND